MPHNKLMPAMAALTASALYVGTWAALGPRSFYDSFPGFHRVWVGVDGPFNEHLVRDVGGLYLALAAAGVVALLRLDGSAVLLLGAAWTAFGGAHLSYHLHHLAELETVDVLGNVMALGGTVVLALYVSWQGLEMCRGGHHAEAPVGSRAPLRGGPRDRGSRGGG